MNGSNYIKYKTLYIINCGPPHKSTTVLDGKNAAYLSFPHCSVHQADLKIYEIYKNWIQLAINHAQWKLNYPEIIVVSWLGNCL